MDRSMRLLIAIGIFSFCVFVINARASMLNHDGTTTPNYIVEAVHMLNVLDGKITRLDRKIDKLIEAQNRR